MSESDTVEDASTSNQDHATADDGPKQVDNPDYHNENHTAVQTCGWTKNAMRGEGKCYRRL